MIILSLPVRRAFIRRWVRDLEAYRMPKEATLRFALRVYEANHHNIDFQAIGLFANACVMETGLFTWEESRQSYTVIGDGPEERFMTHEYALVRPDGSGWYSSILPPELRWLLGFSSIEERVVGKWDLRRVPFPAISDRLRRIYLPEGCKIADEEIAWEIAMAHMPKVETTEERSLVFTAGD